MTEPPPSSWALTTALLFVLTSCGGSPPESTEAPAVAVDLGDAVVRDFDVTLTALATISSQPGSQARVSAPGESFVTRIHVGPGDRVTRGTPLVELDPSVWTRRAQEADAALSAAQAAESRAKKLLDQGIVPRKEVENATSEVARTRASAADIHRTLERAVLRSPIDGVVTMVSAAISQPVAANDVLVEVVDGEGLEALVQLAPGDASRVSPGALIAISGGLDPSAPVVAHGRVKGVSSSVDPSTGTVTVRAALTSVDQPLRPGQTVMARITVSRSVGAVVVPRAALVPVTNGMTVFVVDSAGVAHETSIEIGGQNTDSVEVRSGLAGGERVVTTGAYGVVDGARVHTAGTP